MVATTKSKYNHAAHKYLCDLNYCNFLGVHEFGEYVVLMLFTYFRIRSVLQKVPFLLVLDQFVFVCQSVSWLVSWLVGWFSTYFVHLHGSKLTWFNLYYYFISFDLRNYSFHCVQWSCTSFKSKCIAAMILLF